MNEFESRCAVFDELTARNAPASGEAAFAGCTNDWWGLGVCEHCRGAGGCEPLARARYPGLFGAECGQKKDGDESERRALNYLSYQCGVLAHRLHCGDDPEDVAAAILYGRDCAEKIRQGKDLGDVEAEDRRAVWSFQVDGEHVRWCGTLQQFHSDMQAYVASSVGSLEPVSRYYFRFKDAVTRTTTTFRAVRSTESNDDLAPT